MFYDLTVISRGGGGGVTGEEKHADVGDDSLRSASVKPANVFKVRQFPVSW